ncbi:MAG: hypothetical protein PWQ82_1544 [Thermosediminibacterales bacterium]|nr:hypothetical protein [Thermosediminibacterales bacterium]
MFYLNQPMFTNYYEFINNVQRAIVDEIEAAKFYRELKKMAPSELHTENIQHAIDDEVKHRNMLTQLYMALTGRPPMVMGAPSSSCNIISEEYREGLLKAFHDELEAAEFYRSMLFSTTSTPIRDILFEIMTDEMEHADRFELLYADIS